jgi:hypothetical protein
VALTRIKSSDVIKEPIDIGCAATQYPDVLLERAAKANEESNAAQNKANATITLGDVSEIDDVFFFEFSDIRVEQTPSSKKVDVDIHSQPKG